MITPTPMLESFSSFDIKETNVDFNKRTYLVPIELSQYDDSEDGTLVCIKVNLYKNDEKFYAPEDCIVKVRLGMYGGYFAYYEALGFLEDRSTVIVPVRLQMTSVYGDFYPEIEVVKDGATLASSHFHVHIAKSSVQQSSIAGWATSNDDIAKMITSIATEITTARMNALMNMVNSVMNGIAPITESPTSRAYSKGTFIFYGGKLYKVTVDIPVGATLSVGTNIEESDSFGDIFAGLIPYMLATRVLPLTVNNVSSFPITINDSRIVDDMVCVNATFSNPKAIKSHLSVSTVMGAATITGSIEGTTNITIYIMRKMDDI